MSLWSVVASESKELAYLAVPTIFTNILSTLMNTVDVIMLGHLGRDELAAASLGTLIFNMIWYFALGMTTALDTLAAQAYGMSDHGAVWFWTFMCMCVMSVVLVPCSLVLYHGAWIVQHILGQPVNIAAQSGEFTVLLIPGMWFLMYFTILQKYLQVQNIMAPSLYISLLANIFNVLGNLTFIWGVGLGFKGSPIATTSSRLFMLLSILVYCHFMRKNPHTQQEGKVARALMRALCPCLLSLKVGLSLPSGYSKVPSDLELSRQPGEEKYGLENPLHERCAQTHMHAAKRICPPTPPQLLGSPPRRQYSDEVTRRPRASEDFIYTAPVPDDELSPIVKRKGASLGARHRITLKELGKNTGVFLGLGFPGGVMLGCEAWSFEVTTAFAARLGTVSVDAHSIMLTCCGLTYLSLPLAIAIATSIRVGNLLGAAEAQKAKICSWIAIAAGAVVMTGSGLSYWYWRSHIGSIFTDDEDVRHLVARLALVVAGFQVVDGVQGVCQGVLRGIGRQQQIAMMNIVAFWVVGVPSGHYLTFNAKMGVAGLWFGFVIGLGILMVLLIIIVAKIDWSVEVDKAQQNLVEDKDEHLPK